MKNFKTLRTPNVNENMTESNSAVDLVRFGVLDKEEVQRFKKIAANKANATPADREWALEKLLGLLATLNANPGLMQHYKRLNEGVDGPDVSTAAGVSAADLFAHFDCNKDGIVDIHDYASHIQYHIDNPDMLAGFVRPEMAAYQPENNFYSKLAGAPITLASVTNSGGPEDSVIAVDSIEEAADRQPDPPTIVILKRKAIRIFPNGKRVALYWADKLDRYISVPYNNIVSTDASNSDPAIAEEIALNEGVIHSLRKIVNDMQSGKIKFEDGTSLSVDLTTARHILAVHDALKPENKTKMEEHINKNKAGFGKVLDLAHKHIK